MGVYITSILCSSKTFLGLAIWMWKTWPIWDDWKKLDATVMLEFMLNLK